MRILFIGDIFGSTGKRILSERLQGLRDSLHIDCCIANGENVAGGLGITVNIFRKLRKFGVDIVTGGNHSFAQLNVEPAIAEQPNLLRPHNMPPGNPGTGVCVHTLDDGRQVAALNLLGRTFFNEVFDCPFRCADAEVARLRQSTPFVVVDFHAEATSEKIALAHFLDGRVSAVVGTHTHVQTADERVLAGGTGFITDAGMTGPEDSVIGMRKELVIKRFLLQSRVKLEPASHAAMLNAVVLDLDDTTGLTRSIERIFERITFSSQAES